MFSKLIDAYRQVSSVVEREEILNLQGISIDKLDPIQYKDTIFREGLQNASIDPNANCSKRLAPSKVLHETYKPIEKLYGLHKLYLKMEEMYGKQEATQLFYELINGTLYLHDSTKVDLPYCTAIESIHILMNGRQWNRLRSKAPKHPETYLGQLVETIANMSLEQAGALAISDFFFIYAYLWLKEFDLIGTFLSATPLEVIDNLLEAKREVIKNQFQSFAFAVNNEVRVSGDSPFTNISIFDTYKLKQFIKDRYLLLFDVREDKDIQKIVHFIKEIEFIYMEMKNAEKIPLTFPVDTVNITVNERGEILDRAFYDRFVKLNAETARYNVYLATMDSDKLAMCCRLSFNDDLIKERTKYTAMKKGIDSFGNGAFSIGSFRVVTINLPRLAFLAQDWKRFLGIVQNILEKSRKILLAHREIVKENIKNNMFIAFSYGFLKESNMFSTFGLVGLFEAAKILGISNIPEYVSKMSELLDFIEQEIQQFVKEDNVFYNVECVPAESAAATLAKMDNLLYSFKVNGANLYSNQFIPLWENVDVFTKIDVDAALVKKLSGGAISHINIGSQMTFEQMKSLISYCAQKGLEHFAVNPIISECPVGHVFYGKYDICPTCGADIKNQWSRIVGYFVPVSHWNKYRQEEFEKRIVYDFSDWKIK